MPWFSVKDFCLQLKVPRNHKHICRCIHTYINTYINTDIKTYLNIYPNVVPQSYYIYFKKKDYLTALLKTVIKNLNWGEEEAGSGSHFVCSKEWSVPGPWSECFRCESGGKQKFLFLISDVDDNKWKLILNVINNWY